MFSRPSQVEVVNHIGMGAAAMMARPSQMRMAFGKVWPYQHPNSHGTEGKCRATWRGWLLAQANRAPPMSTVEFHSVSRLTHRRRSAHALAALRSEKPFAFSFCPAEELLIYIIEQITSPSHPRLIIA